jgi:hypothetical protein
MRYIVDEAMMIIVTKIAIFFAGILVNDLRSYLDG